MAMRKRNADLTDAKARTGLKKAGVFYSGKGSGSADAQAGRGAARRDTTLKALGSESKKTGSAPAKSTTSSSGRQAANTVGGAKKQAAPAKSSAPKTTSTYKAGPMKPKTGASTTAGGPKKPSNTPYGSKTSKFNKNDKYGRK